MGFHFLKKSSKNIEMAPRGARSKLLIFDEPADLLVGGWVVIFFVSLPRLPGETGEVSRLPDIYIANPPHVGGAQDRLPDVPGLEPGHQARHITHGQSHSTR